eukprot:1179150-Prorocentrum_minimum.AAC.6
MPLLGNRPLGNPWTLAPRPDSRERATGPRHFARATSVYLGVCVAVHIGGTDHCPGAQQVVGVEVDKVARLQRQRGEGRLEVRWAQPLGGPRVEAESTLPVGRDQAEHLRRVIKMSRRPRP